MIEPSAASPSGEKRGRLGRHRLGAVGVLGELFITGGLVILLFLAWQLWVNDIVVGAVQDQSAASLSRSWAQDVAPSTSPAPTSSTMTPLAMAQPPDDDKGGVVPVVMTETLAVAQRFATLYVPRFGATYVRTIGEGVETEGVLNKVGIGHYPKTAMPGGVGNFGIAAHRTTYGAPFGKINELQVGDKLYVETQDGWYTYIFRGLEYVRPSGVGVLDPVPQNPGIKPVDRIMTMTSCNPPPSSRERIIAYSVYDSWQPRSTGPPAEIETLVKARS